ncbi:MAG: peptide chain release factor N(5)-glutamine methyltransferase [Candidatus Kuenenbacteria bacterium]
MTICQTLDWAIEKLGQNKGKNKDNAELDAEILLLHILNHDRAWLYSHAEYILSPTELRRFRHHIVRRAKGEPVAYITEHKEFYGLDFYVNKNVLIPRPETELMVENALQRICRDTKFCASTKNNKILVIDIGAGSGCIPVTILKNLNSNCQIAKLLYCYASDISKQALAIARKNAKRHGIEKQIKFLQGNLLEPIIKEFSNGTMEQCSNGIVRQYSNGTIIITANLPYLSHEIYKTNYENLKFEPKDALVSENNGLDLYEKILKQIKNSLLHCCIITLLLEIDPSQNRLIKTLIQKYFPKSKIQIKKDLAHKNRLVIINP